MRLKGTAVIAASAVFVLALGCSSENSEPDEGPLLGPGSVYRVPEHGDVQTYFKAMLPVNEATAEIRYSEDFVEHLPNQRFAVNGGEEFSLSAGIVVGEVRDVLPGMGYVAREGGNDGSESLEVPFDDPNAQWRIARVRIAVSEWFAEGDKPEFVDVGAFVPHPDGKLGRSEVDGLSLLGEVAVIIDPARTYEWDPSVLPVARGGLLLGDIDSEGHIGFPSLGEESATFVGGAQVPDLRRGWEADPPLIEVELDMETGMFERG